MEDAEYRRDIVGALRDYEEDAAMRVLTYGIINALLNNVTFSTPVAEAMLLIAVKDEAALDLAVCLRIEEVFSPIFFNYPSGLTDRSIWQARRY